MKHKKNGWERTHKVKTIQELADNEINVSKQYMSRCLKNGKNTFDKHGVIYTITKDDSPSKHGFEIKNLETGITNEIYGTMADAARGLGISYQTLYRHKTWPQIVRKNKVKYEVMLV